VNNEWYSVTYGNGLFVAVGGSGTGNRVMTSPDGINWTTRNSAANNAWVNVGYGDGLFVAVAVSGTGNRVMTSPDGINWTIRNSAANNDWRSVVYGNGMFVVVGRGTNNPRVMISGKTETNALAHNNIYQGGIDVRGATSTFSNGINLTGGCFAVDGVCIGGGGSESTSWSTTSAEYMLSLDEYKNMSWSTTSANYYLSSGTVGTSTFASLIVSNVSTSTFAGFIDVNGTNGTSTIAGNLWVKGAIKIGNGSLYLTEDGLFSSNGQLVLSATGPSLINTELTVPNLIGEGGGGGWSTTSADYWESTQASRGGVEIDPTFTAASTSLAYVGAYFFQQFTDELSFCR
jgi:hypothetical protein